MNQLIVYGIILLSQFYLCMIALNAYYGRNPEAHFIVFKRFLSTVDPTLKPRYCGNCTLRTDFPTYRLIGDSGQLNFTNLYRVLTMDIDSIDKALFFLYLPCDKNNHNLSRVDKIWTLVLFFSGVTTMSFGLKLYLYIMAIFIQSLYLFNTIKAMERATDFDLKAWYLVDTTFFGLTLINLLYFLSVQIKSPKFQLLSSNFFDLKDSRNSDDEDYDQKNVHHIMDGVVERVHEIERPKIFKIDNIETNKNSQSLYDLPIIN